MTRLRAVLLVPVLLAALTAACGDDDDGDAVGTQGTDATTTTAASSDGDYGGSAGGDSGAAKIVVEGFAFSEATVAPGAEVAIENADDVPHTVTADDDAFDSGSVAGGASGSVTAPDEPGDYAYHCEIHPDMKGTLTVEG